MHTPSPDELRQMIDETLAEIEDLEAAVLELFTQVLGPQAAQQVAAYIEAQETAPRVAPLKRAASSGPSTTPPATP